MPISKYNPDGTVDIYNTKTGEVKAGVQAGELGAISPKLVAEYQTGQAPEKVLARKEAEIKLKDIESGIGTEAQQEKVSLARTLGSDIKLLEETRKNISKPFRGRLRVPAGEAEKPGIIGGIARSIEPDISAFEGLRENVSFSLAGAIANQTGRALSDEERAALAESLPDIGDTDAEAQIKLNNLAKQLETRLIEAGQTPEQAKEFSDKLLSGLNLDEGNGVEKQVAEEAIPSFETAPPEELRAVEEATAEKKSLAGFGENVLNDLQGLVEGVVNLPSAFQQVGEEISTIGPSIFGPGVDFVRTETGQAMLGSIVEEYKNLITHPLEQAYEHPVNTILDVIPFLSGLKKLKAGKLAGVTSEEAGVAKMAAKAEDITEIGIAKKALGEVEEVAPVSRVGGILPTRGEIAAKTFSSAFIVPTKRARNLRPIETSAKMLDYGVSGSLDEMSDIASKVTGDTGVLTKVTRNAIGSLQGEVEVGKAAGAAENMLKEVIELTPIEKSRILRNIAGAEKTGKEVMKVNPLDAYDTAKRLEKLGYQYLKTNTYLTGNVKNIGIGNAYLAAADEIMSSLEIMAGEQDILLGFKNPEILSELESVSPKLANEYLQAKTLGDIRHLQLPFVRINQMIDLTEEAANSAFMAGRVGKIGGGISGLIGGSILGGVPGAIAGGIAGTVFGPPLEAAAQAMRPSILTKTARMIAH